MDYVFLIAGIVVIITCFYFIASPFFTENNARKEQRGETLAKETVTLDVVYSAVNELEMDYLMKKIPEQDYKEMKERYQLLAAKLMRTETQEEEVKTVTETAAHKVDEDILEELRKIRERKG